MDLIEAAALLGVPALEVRSVEASPAGDVIVTADGVAYVVVPATAPDGAGLSGVMYLSAPHDRYGDAFPVYQRPGAPGEDEVGRDGGVMSKADLLARARELGIEATGKWGEAKLRAAIAAAETAPPAGGDGDGSEGGAVPGDGQPGDEGVLTREELEDVAIELGIDHVDDLSDDELADAVAVARGDV